MIAHRRLDFADLLGYGGALLFVVCLYTSPAHLYPQLAFLRPAMLAAAAMAAAVVLRRMLDAEPVRLGGGAGAAVAVLFVLIGLSPLWALNTALAVAFGLAAIKLLVAYVGLTGALFRPGRVGKAMTVAALASVVPAWGTVTRWRDGIDLVEGFRGAWIGLLANPNEVATVMAITAPWTLLARERARGLLRLGLLAAFGLQCAAVVVTHSRGGMLGFCAAMLMVFLLSRRRLPAVGFVAAALVAALAWAPSSFWERTATIRSYETDASARGRLLTWETGRRALADRPLFGVGGGGYLDAWDRYGARNVRERAFASHNLWMQVAVELGVVGLAAFASMLVLLVRGLWKARHLEGYGDEARALLASLAALVVAGQTGGYAFNWFTWMLLGVAGAVVAGARALRPAGAADALRLAPA